MAKRLQFESNRSSLGTACEWVQLAKDAESLFGGTVTLAEARNHGEYELSTKAERLKATHIYRRTRRLAHTALPNSWFEVRNVLKIQDTFLEAGVAFVHVPRAAGWSISSALYGRHSGHFTVDQFIRYSNDAVLNLPRFAVVRNPWDRAVSAFHFAKIGRVAGGSEIANPRRYQGKEFDSFLTYVYEFLGRHDVCKLDPVFKPQSRYTVDRDGRTAFEHIGRFDDIAKTESWLSDAVGLPFSFPRSNQTVRDEYRSYYDAQTRDFVGRIYSEDIERFGFRF